MPPPAVPQMSPASLLLALNMTSRARLSPRKDLIPPYPKPPPVHHNKAPRAPLLPQLQNMDTTRAPNPLKPTLNPIRTHIAQISSRRW